jgi:DinB superfamily
MHLASWFRDQLQSSGDGFAWSVQQIPTTRWLLQPPVPLGGWSAARHVFHILFYEERFALASMHQWLGAPIPDPSTYDEAVEEAAWARNQMAVDALLARFQARRAEHLVLLTDVEAAVWEQPRMAIWGQVSLRWVVSKTYQHTAEHISDMLKLALFWDIFLARQESADTSAIASP